MADKTEGGKIRWRWGFAAALSMMVLSFYPQVHFWVVRGSQWNGSYAAMEGVGDEIAYSAYINALIDGRPRRNDPYTGRDFTADEQQKDSLFSIQFVPAYLIATPARLLGISTATAFIVLSPLAAGASAMALFWLLAIATKDDRISAAGVITVLCLGTLVAGHGYASSFFGQQPLYNYLLFLRRYQPAATFPLFIAFCACFLLAITVQSKKKSSALAMIAAMLLALLVFSYVYLWTAAAAWVTCLLGLWLVAKPEGWRASLRAFAILGAGGLLALAGFVIAFSNRAASMDSVQALEISHVPDVLRVPALVGIAVLIMLAWLASRGAIHLKDRQVLIAASFALLPLIVFNQQIATGHSLQPLHYEMFVANYSALIAAVISAAVVRPNTKSQPRRLPRRALIMVALLAFEWGAYETLVATRGSMSFDHDLDDARAVAVRLSSIARREGKQGTYATLLSTDLFVADGLPSSAPQSILWAPHMLVFSGASNEESKERFYQYLYYTGVSPEKLKSILRYERRYGFAVGLFGFERTIRGLSSNPKPIGEEEVAAEIARYSDYAASFDAQEAGKVRISYVVARADEQPNLAHLDRWYERDAGEHIGNFILYRTRFRSQPDGLSNNTAPDLSSRSFGESR
ncbi:MAG TPA: hypothetical protein VIV66_05145 [Pyrinomonadaceae bacterium]